MKLKEFGPPGGGRPSRPPLDLPLNTDTIMNQLLIVNNVSGECMNFGGGGGVLTYYLANFFIHRLHENKKKLD